MVRFQLIRMFSYANNKLQMCSVNQHQCRRRECFHKFTTLYLLQKMTCLDWTIYSWYGFNSWGCPLMLRTNYRCVQLPNISVDVAKHEENFQNSPSTLTHYLSQKNDLSWLNNLFMVGFQLIRMFSYAKNKLQMFSVTQNQCRRRQMWGNFSQIHPVRSLFISYKKWFVLTEQSIHGKV